MSENLETKIKELETKVEALYAKVEEQNSLIADLQKQLSLAVKTVSGETPDPQNALLKARNVLERVVGDVYEKEFKKPHATQNLSDMIFELAKSDKIEWRIKIIMDSIRSMANYGVHGGIVKVRDALYILDLIYEITDWYMDNYKVESVVVPSEKSVTENEKPKVVSKKTLEYIIEEEQRLLLADFEIEQNALADKYDLDEVAKLKFIGDPRGQEMLKALSIETRQLAKKYSEKTLGLLTHIKSKVKEELNNN